MCIVYYQRYGTFRHTRGDITDAEEYSGCCRLILEWCAFTMRIWYCFGYDITVRFIETRMFQQVWKKYPYPHDYELCYTSPELHQHRNRRYLRAITDVSASSADTVALNDLRTIANVATPNTDVSTPSANVFASSAYIVASNDKCFMMFHNILSVLWCFTYGSRCITMFYMCFMFYYV